MDLLVLKCAGYHGRFAVLLHLGHEVLNFDHAIVRNGPFKLELEE